MDAAAVPHPRNASPTAVTSTEAPIDKPPPPPVDLPPRNQMDGFLRPLLSALSSRPELARWLATDDLIGQLAAAIDQASGGGSPARDFKVIAPAPVHALRPRQQPHHRSGQLSAVRRPRADGDVDRRVECRADLPDDPAAVERGVPRHRPSQRRCRSRPSAGDRHPAGHACRQDPIAIVEGRRRLDLCERRLEELAPTQKQLYEWARRHADG